MFGGSRGRAERLFEEGDADPLRAAHGFQGGRRPRLALHHLGEQGQPDADDLALLGQAGHGLFQKLFLLLAQFAFRKNTESSAKGCQHLFSVTKRNQVHQRTVLPFDQSDFQIPQKPADSKPEVVPHHDHALRPATVALPQGLHQFGVLLLLLGVQPLLELVEDDDDLLADRDALPPA